MLLKKCQEFSLGVAKKLVSLGVDGIWAGDDDGAQNNTSMENVEAFITAVKRHNEVDKLKVVFILYFVSPMNILNM